MVSDIALLYRQLRDVPPVQTLSLLSVFETSRRFPLFQRGDPHWSRVGADLVAETVARRLAAEGLVPCRLPEPIRQRPRMGSL